jgi:hypothetical protein
MTNDTAGTTSATRGTGHETVSLLVTPVDEKRFESEMRRTDAAVSEEKKNREKFETRIEKAVNDLRGEMNSRFDRMEKSVGTRFEKVDAHFEKLENKIDSNFKTTVTIYLTTTGILLAAFYAFASYIKG